MTMNNTILQKFDVVIGGPDTGWQEYSVQMCADIFYKFSDSDWHQLALTVTQQSSYWQERCIEAIGMSENERGIPVLLSLINSKSIQVSVIAASELDNLDVNVPANYWGRLRELLRYVEDQRSSRKEDVQRLLDQNVD